MGASPAGSDHLLIKRAILLVSAQALLLALQLASMLVESGSGGLRSPIHGPMRSSSGADHRRELPHAQNADESDGDDDIDVRNPNALNNRTNTRRIRKYQHR